MSAEERAAIARAEAATRVAALARRAKAQRELAGLLAALSDTIRADIAAHGGQAGRVPASALPSIRAFLGNRLSTFSKEWQTLLGSGLRDAVSIGARLLNSVGRTGADAAHVGLVIQSLRDFVAADGLQLSDRIWRSDNVLREKLRAAIEGAIARGESAAAATARALGDGRPPPPDTAAGLAAAQPDAIGSAIAGLLNPDAPGSAAFNYSRLFRTEMNRAYTESYLATVVGKPDVAGVKFLLSPNHPRVDVCDGWASANLHGLGVGVYPATDCPYPAHPQTLSYLVRKYVDEVTDADRAGKQTMFDWLATQPASAQDAVLGGQRKGAAFRDGKLQPNELRAPWYQIAARLGIPEGDT